MSNSNWSASAVQPPSPIPAPAKPPGMTLPEAMGHLRQGRKIIHADWQPWCYVVADSDGRIHDQEGDRIELHTVMVLSNGLEDRDWYLYEGPVTETPEQMPVQSALATIEQAMVDDIELAWGWHCNIAMAIYDCGGRSHAACNKGAALFLSRLFPRVDTTKHPAYVAITQTIEDVPPRLTTIESLQALVAGKRVRQTHPQRGSA